MKLWGQTLLLTVSCYRAAWHKKRGLCPSSHTWFSLPKTHSIKTRAFQNETSAQMLMTSHLWCFPHNSWGRGPPCRWACHSSTQHPCAWWRGYSRPVERTALPLSSLHNHTEPPPTPRQSETPTKKRAKYTNVQCTCGKLNYNKTIIYFAQNTGSNCMTNIVWIYYRACVGYLSRFASLRVHAWRSGSHPCVNKIKSRNKQKILWPRFVTVLNNVLVCY